MKFRGVTTNTLVPDFEEGVPRAGADGHPVLCDAEAGHAIVVAGQHACAHTQPGGHRVHSLTEVRHHVPYKQKNNMFRTKKQYVP